MKKLRKIIAVILCITLSLTVSLPSFTVAKAEQNITTVRYSDLFYSYSSYFKESNVFNSYCNITQSAFDTVYNEYLDSPDFKWMLVKEGLKEAVDLRSFFETVSDAYADTVFNYNDALDCANKIFAQNLLVTNASEYNTLDTASYWAKNLNNMYGLYKEISAFELKENVTDKDVAKKAFELIRLSGILKNVSDSTLAVIEYEVIESWSTILSMASIAGDALIAAKALMTALMMEDMRCTFAAEILSITSSGALYDGMSRLTNQLRSGFVSYFIDNYIKKDLLSKVADYAVKQFVASAFTNGAGLYNLTTAIIKVGTWVIFDVVFDVADFDEVTTQLVLKQYTKELRQMIVNKSNCFSEQFEYSDIGNFGILFNALKAATDSAITASEKIKLDSNSGLLNGVRHKYYDYDLYMNTVHDIRATLNQIPDSQRVRNYYDNWSVPFGEYVIAYSSDKIESNRIYFTNGVFNGNITVSSGGILISQGYTTHVVNGNITVGNNGKLNVNGKLAIIGNLTANYSSNTYIDGALTVTGNVDLGSNGNESYFGVLYMSNENSKLYVGGNFTATDKAYNCKITNGEVILCGNSQQTVKNLKPYNLTVTNPEGIKYNSDLYINGHYNLGGNPLDSNGFKTFIYSTTASFDEVSDFGIVYVNCTYTLKGKLNADLTVPNGKTLNVAENTNATVNGNLTANYSSNTYIDGALTVTGNVDLGSNGNESYFGVLYMSNENSKLYVGGNFTATDKAYNCKITNGEVILCGNSQQTVKNLKPYNLTVTNPEGIKYNSDLYIYGHYNLGGNPLDSNGFKTFINSTTTSFDEVSDFGKVYVNCNYTLKGNLNANLTVPYGKRLNIAESTSAAVNGNLTVDYYSSAYIDGALTVTGNVDLGSNGNESYFGVLYMSNENSKLYVGGNFIAVNKTYNCKITNGEVIFCGDKLQKVNKITAPTIILENKSQDGVVFGSAISPTVLFNHNGLNFTLYNNGSGSVFKDYDGDLVKDNVDDNPTVFSNHNYYNVVCDINGSGKTDLLDFIRFKKLLANNQSGSNIDFNNDGLVNAQDITIMKEFLIDCFK